MSLPFVSFEGIDGCGKSTQLKLLSDYLVAKDVKVVSTREPGGTPISEKIRELILSKENGEMDRNTELLLYVAARAQHVSEKIRPALNSGKVVLTDRFFDATIAYQGGGREIDMNKLIDINLFATEGIVPTRTYLFDLPVETAFTRIGNTGKDPDRLESLPVEWFESVRAKYIELAAEEPDRFLIIDATMSIDEISNLLRNDINLLFDL